MPNILAPINSASSRRNNRNFFLASTDKHHYHTAVQYLALLLGAIFWPHVSDTLRDLPIPSAVLTHHKCQVKGYGSGYCLRIGVPENRSLAAGRKVSLYVVYFPSYDTAARDAVTFLAGGPGEGSADQMPGLLSRDQIDHLLAHHGLLFVDGRGTGFSDNIDCPVHWSTPQQYFTSVVPLLDDDELQKCRDALSKRADLSQYGTDEAADDLDDVRADLGISQLTLMGFSAGTSEAQEYSRRHRAHVRAIVMGGVATTSLHYPAPASRAKEIALQEVLYECLRDRACDARFPALESDYREMVRRARSGIRTYVGTNKVYITYPVFAGYLGFLLYTTDSVAELPYVVHEGARGNWEPFAAVTYKFAVDINAPLAPGAASDVSKGVYFSSMCSETVPFTNAKDIASTAGTFTGATRIAAYERACRIWNVPLVARSYLDPAPSSAPTLMISNRFDPATPWWIAHSIVHLWPHARQVTDYSTGHINDWQCIMSTSLPFAETLNLRAVDDTCARHPKPIHFALHQGGR